MGNPVRIVLRTAYKACIPPPTGNSPIAFAAMADVDMKGLASSHCLYSQLVHYRIDLIRARHV
jgi:hypothetical protein